MGQGAGVDVFTAVFLDNTAAACAKPFSANWERRPTPNKHHQLRFLQGTVSNAGCLHTYLSLCN